MKKPFKVISTTAMAAVFATTSLVPAAVAAEPQNQEIVIDFVIFDTKDGILTLPLLDYTIDYSDLNTKVTQEQLKFIQSSDGKYYNFLDYVLEYSGDSTETFELLEPINLTDIKQGKIDGEWVVAADEQPEDRLNETFFYNFAA